MLGHENVPLRESSYPRFNGGLPLQQSVSSASKLPKTSIRALSSSNHVASAQYVDQYRSLLEHQRQVFDEERALWHTERLELHGKVKELESIIQNYKARNGKQVSPAAGDLPGYAPGSFGNYSVYEPPNGGGTSLGDEFWRGSGGKSDAQPVRSFSESALKPSKPEDKRMPSIAEDAVEKPRSRDVSPFSPLGLGLSRKVSPNNKLPRHKSIRGTAVHQNLDGINFKSSSLPPPLVNKVENQSGSHSPRSPNQTSPGVNDVVSAKNLQLSEDPYTRHAGHTPLAQSDSTAMSSELGSPIRSTIGMNTEGEQERQPYEPRPSVARPPNERSGSYFPVHDHVPENASITNAVDHPIDGPSQQHQDLDQSDRPDEINSKTEREQNVAIDTDPKLREPLSLHNTNDASDKGFLSELDNKLIQAARSKVHSPPDDLEGVDNKENQSKANGNDDSNGCGKENGNSFDNSNADGDRDGDADEMPRLRIKRSMNFGSQFGALK